MTANAPETQEDAAAPRRFAIDLFIVHPTLKPTEISDSLGLDPTIVHCVGDERRTPKGRKLDGVYPDTRWRHSLRCEVKDQWFAHEVTAYVDRLMSRAESLHRLRATGGQISLIVRFLGDGYFGDDIGYRTLARLAALELDLAIECYQVPQS